MSQNGKGDRPRPVNQKVYEANYNAIFRKPKKQKKNK